MRVLDGVELDVELRVCVTVRDGDCDCVWLCDGDAEPVEVTSWLEDCDIEGVPEVEADEDWLAEADCVPVSVSLCVPLWLFD